MPENAEVAHITDQLNFFFSERILDDFEFITDTFVKKCKNFEDFKDLLPLKIKEVKCKGKMIIFVFYRKIKGIDKGDNIEEKKDIDGEDNNLLLSNTNNEKYYYLCSGLGMTGHYSFDKNCKNTHLKFQFVRNKDENGINQIKYLYYSDHRRFGNFYFFCCYDDYIKKFKKIKNGFLGQYVITKEQFLKNLIKYKENKRRKIDKAICDVLVDQKTLCSGIGNYLLSEVLYEADIDPWKLTSDITKKEGSKIYNSCVKIINKAYECGGLSFSDYSDLNDQEGTYKQYLLIYRKKKTLKNEKVLVREKSDKRSVYYVKNQGSSDE